MATTRNYVWRTTSKAFSGAVLLYVDSYLGSDIYGNGTAQKPYKTLSKAWSSNSTAHMQIVCRGLFVENLNNIRTNVPYCLICADYWGAATIIGGNSKNIQNTMFRYMVVRDNANCGLYGNDIGAGGQSLYGIMYGYNTLIGCSLRQGVFTDKLYYQISSFNLNYSVFSRLTSGFKFNSTAGRIVHNTFFSKRIDSMSKDSGTGVLSTNLFCDFDRPANESISYTQSLFGRDCRWYYLAGSTYNAATDEEIVLSYGEGTTSETRRQELLDRLGEIYEERGVAAASRVYPTFTNCIFSGQTAAEILNDPENDDYTLIPGCDADLGNGKYIGALKPSKKIPIMDNSEGIKETWDERSASGCIVVDNGKICIDDTNDGDGEILSKVLTINPSTTQFDAVYANFHSQFADYFASANMNNFLSGVEISPKNDPDEEETESNTLVAGNRYLMSAACEYNGNAINAGNVLVCNAADVEKFFTADPLTDCKAQEILEPNIMEVLYCRCRNAVYVRVGVSDSLQAGATYLNDSGMNITYHDRTVANGESFVCMIDGEHFSCEDSTKKIAVLFDDTRVPAVEWIPAQTFGSYFVAKSGGAILKDTYGVPKSSGNLRAYPTTGLNLSTMDRKYVQFAVKIKRYVARVD